MHTSVPMRRRRSADAGSFKLPIPNPQQDCTVLSYDLKSHLLGPAGGVTPYSSQRSERAHNNRLPVLGPYNKGEEFSYM